jgi:hypothetical protein
MKMEQINSIIKQAKPDIDLSGQTSKIYRLGANMRIVAYFLPQQDNPKLVCMLGLATLLNDIDMVKDLIENGFVTFDIDDDDVEVEHYIFSLRDEAHSCPTAHCFLYCGVNWIQVPKQSLPQETMQPAINPRKPS